MFLNNPFHPPVDFNLPNLFTEETIASVVKYAKTQPPSVHKLQLCSYPPSFAEVTMNSEKKVSMHVVNGNKDDNYPSNIDEACKLGYKWYKESLPDSEQPMSKVKFNRLHKSVCNKIDKSIESHHGIICTIEIGTSTTRLGGFDLHFCDLLTIKLALKQSKPAPDVIIRNNIFDRVPENIISSIFDEVMGDEQCFNELEREFVFKNASLFYFIYGYWHNYSNKAIHISFNSLDNIEKAQLLASNDVFLRLQEAKHNQIDRRAQGREVRTLYLLD